MGTRWNFQIIIDDEVKVSKYGQWDGYLGGQGLKLLQAVKDFGIDNIKEGVQKLEFFTPSELNDLLISQYSMDQEGFITRENTNLLRYDQPLIHRSVDIYTFLDCMIMGNHKSINDFNIGFCHYQYIIDLTKNILRINFLYEESHIEFDLNNLPCGDEFVKADC